MNGTICDAFIQIISASIFLNLVVVNQLGRFYLQEALLLVCLKTIIVSPNLLLTIFIHAFCGLVLAFSFTVCAFLPLFKTIVILSSSFRFH